MTHTYNPSDVVKVDSETAKFIEESEKWAETAKEREAKNREAKLNQALFTRGALAAISEESPDILFYGNSDAYFEGFSEGKRAANRLIARSKELYPATTGFKGRINIPQEVCKGEIK